MAVSHWKLFWRKANLRVCHIRDVFLPDSNRVSAATVASTAIAAAQWAVTQVWKSTLPTVISFHFIKNGKQDSLIAFCFFLTVLFRLLRMDQVAAKE